MGVKLHKLRQGSSIERYINDLDTLARHLELPEQQKIHYFIFWLKPKLEQALLIRQLQTYDDAVIFAKRKHHFADTNCDTQLTDLLQEIHKEVSLKHTGTKQEPYSAPVHNTHTNYFQQNISLLQTDIQSLKDAINTPHTQYAAPLDTNPVALQQQLSNMKEDVKHLQQIKRPNIYSTPPGNYKSFRTTDGLVICRRCNQVGHAARACPENLRPLRAPTHYQNRRHNYVPSATSQHPHSSHAPNRPSNQYSQRPSYRSNTNRHDTMGYPYPRNATHTNSSRRPAFSFADQTDNKYEARTSNIPGPHNNYSNLIQNHALKDRQCLVSGTLDDKPITILIDTGSSINLLNEQLYYSLSFVPPLQPIQFSVSGADNRPLIALGITSLSIVINDNTFQVQLVITRNILFPVVLGIDFLQTHGGIINFPTSQLYLTTSSPTPVDQSINAKSIYNTYTPPIHAPTSYHPHPRITVPSNHPYHVINTAPVTISARTNTILTIPFTLPRSGNYLSELSAQSFADHPVHCTPVTINAANDNLPVHFINHSDRDVVVPKHTYVGAMEKVQDQTKITYLPMLPQNQLFNTHYPNVLPTVTYYPANANRCIPSFKKTQVCLDPVLLISPVPHLYNIALTLVMLNPSSKDSTSSNLLNRKLTLKLTPSRQGRHCTR